MSNPTQEDQKVKPILLEHGEKAHKRYIFSRLIDLESNYSGMKRVSQNMIRNVVIT